MNVTDPTLIQLYQSILDNPLEDTPRLAYADRLDEIGGEEYEARAEYIRLSIRLHNIGPEPVTLERPIMVRRGEGYYQVEPCGLDTMEDFQVGDRVSIFKGEFLNKKNQVKSFHRLKVMKVIESNDGVVLSVKKDEDSIPYPKKEVKAIKERTEEIHSKYGWGSEHSAAGLTQSRGFLSKLELSVDEDLIEVVIRNISYIYPVSEVVIRAEVEEDFMQNLMRKLPKIPPSNWTYRTTPVTEVY